MSDVNNGTVSTAFAGSYVYLEWQAFTPTGVTKPQKAGYVVLRDSKAIKRLGLSVKEYTDSGVVTNKKYVYSVTFHSS